MTAPSTDRAPGARVATGIAGLDAVLHGGLARGGIYIVQGSPGAGKTILANQICFNHIASGGIASFFTLLAENHARMMDNMRAMAFFDERQIPDKLVYESAFSQLRDEGLDGLLRLLRREIQRRKTSMLVIDGLVSVRAVASSDQEFKGFVHALQEIALVTNCTMLLTTNDGCQRSPEQTMVDGLITLRAGRFGSEATSDLQITKHRGSGYLGGVHSYKITDRGISVHPRIEAIHAVPSRPDGNQAARLASGVDPLDALVDGGIPECSTTMLAGPSGIGKTTLGLHFLSRSSSGEPGLLFGFHETPARLRAKAERFGLSFGALEEAGHLELIWQTPRSDVADAHAERLLDAVQARGVKRLFLDGIVSFRRSLADPARAEGFFATLLDELRVRGVTTLFTLELPDILSTKAHVPITDTSSFAENMLLMRFFEGATTLRRILSIVKMRDSGFDPFLHEFAVTEAGWTLIPGIFAMDTPRSDGDAGMRQSRRD